MSSASVTLLSTTMPSQQSIPPSVLSSSVMEATSVLSNSMSPMAGGPRTVTPMTSVLGSASISLTAADTISKLYQSTVATSECLPIPPLTQVLHSQAQQSSSTVGALSSSSPLCLANICSTPLKPSREEIYEHIGKFICQVQTTDGTATGFFIRNNLVVVPLHIVVREATDDNRTIFKPILCFDGGNVYEAECCYDYPLEMLESLDCAVFKIMDTDFSPRPPLSVFMDELKPGKKVYFGGFPLTQIDPTFHSGTISSLHKPSGDTDISYFTIDGTVVAGNSGSPVFALHQGILQLVGFISHQIADFDPDVRRTIDLFYAFKNQNIEVMKASFSIPTNRGAENIEVGSIRTSALIFDLIQRNLSTGIGHAIHVGHLSQLLQKQSIKLTSLVARGMPAKHGTLRIENVTQEGIKKAVKKSIYHEIILFFFSILKSPNEKKGFYSKFVGPIGTIYSFSQWRLDRQPPPQNFANLQVQYENQTLATILISSKLLQYGNNEQKIAEVANYVAYQFACAVKYCQKNEIAVVYKVHPK